MSVALLIASIALVAITAVYAWFTRAMVYEMRATRALAVAPRLALDFDPVGPIHMAVRITNIGAGSALQVKATMSAPRIEDERVWSRSLLKPGDSAEFFLRSKSDDSGQIMDMNALADRNVVVQLKTEALDVYGTRHETTDEIDVKDWWASVTSSQQSFTESPDKVRNRELEKIRKELEAVRRVGTNLPRELGNQLSEALRAEPPKPE